MRPTALLVAAICLAGVAADNPVVHTVHLVSEGMPPPGSPLAEYKPPIQSLTLRAKLDGKGEGAGTLTISPTILGYDELGNYITLPQRPDLTLDCALKFRKTVVVARRVRPQPGAAEQEVEEVWRVYAVTGPKITSRLTVVVPPDANWKHVRLVVRDADDKVTHAFHLGQPQVLHPPCHPGCFPAGTAIRVPGGTTPVDRLRGGDEVVTVGPDGVPATARVLSVFITKNRLLEVRTADGALTTTETQPLALEAGGYRLAGELKPGDRVWVWAGAGRRATAVRAVTPPGGEAEVFNLVLGAPTTFVAGGLLARSKPPGPPPAAVPQP